MHFHVLELKTPNTVAHESASPEEPGGGAMPPMLCGPFQCYSMSRNTWENNSEFIALTLFFILINY